MLSRDELLELEEDIMSALPDCLTEALTLANRSGRLVELLKMLGLSELIGTKSKFDTYTDGKIVVLGGSTVKEDVLLSIGKQLGIDKKRFEMCLDYDSLQKYNVRKMQYAPQYRVILCGPAPHSGQGKGDSSSIITELENSDAYPRVERLVAGNELKITKSNFRAKLQELVDEGYI